jgi:signal transduction histidine kinase
MINLISNAIKFTQAGNININATLKNKCDDKVIIELSVKDSGIGMTQEQQKIYLPLFHKRTIV